MNRSFASFVHVQVYLQVADEPFFLAFCVAFYIVLAAWEGRKRTAVDSYSGLRQRSRSVVSFSASRLLSAEGLFNS
jgi:hypothetical protein